MAVSTMDRTLVKLMVVCVLTSLVVDVAEARRGGGRGGSRGSSGRGRTKTNSGSRSNTKTTNYRNVALSGRIVEGSSPYTKNNWRAAAARGLIFGGVAYLAMNRHRSYVKMPTICTNNYEKSPEGRTYGNFICPLTSNAANETYCCGKEHREYCCNKYEAQKYYAKHHRSSSSSRVGKTIGLSVLLVFVGIICVIVYSWKKRKGPLYRMCGKKKATPEPHYPDSASYHPPQAPGVASPNPAPVGGSPYPLSSDPHVTSPYPVGPPPSYPGVDNPVTPPLV